MERESKTWIISDLHIGHRNILKFSPNRLGTPVSHIGEHDNLLAERWAERVHNTDMVYVLGDVTMNKAMWSWFHTWPGRKILVRGNHDMKFEREIRRAFEQIHGVLKYQGVWLTHMPVHPQELFGKPNIHGHVHEHLVMLDNQLDKRYRSVCIEHNHGWPELLADVIEEVKSV